MSLFDDLPEPVATNKLVSKRGLSVESGDDPNAPIRKKPTFDLINFAVSVAAEKGERVDMQDEHLVVKELTEAMTHNQSGEAQRVSLFAVFDGHRGIQAASFSKKRLPIHLAARFPSGGVAQIEKNIKRVIVDAYKTTDEEFLREAARQRPHWKDGSTATTVLLVNNSFYIANIGDSAVVVARTQADAIGKVNEGSTLPIGLSALPLTRDHTPQDYQERMRIIRAGANVINGRVNNALEVSRSFGDYMFKTQGVTCIPDVRKYELTGRDKFLLIACDGLWKCFPPEEAVGLTNQLLTTNELIKTFMLGAPVTDASALQRALDAVCAQIVHEAILRLAGDNVTCILLVFSHIPSPPPKHPSPPPERPSSPSTLDPAPSADV